MPLPRLALLLCLGACGQDPDPGYLHWQGQTMGTEYAISVNAENETRHRLASKVDAILDGINARMSTYIPDSELMRLNRAPADVELPVSEELFTVLEAAMRVSEMTGGAFDITAGGLVELWGFGAAPKRHSPPSDAELAAALEKTGYRLIKLDRARRSLRKGHPEAFMDLSGIAKGYAVDRIADWLLADGYRDFIIEIGGEIRAHGRNPRGEDWSIGIERPSIMPSGATAAAAMRQAAHILPLRDTGLASSGDYRDYSIINGEFHFHVIDPSTGHALRHSLASATVIHPQAMIADALATAMLVMGAEPALAWANQQGLGILLIERAASGSLRMRQSRCMPQCPPPGQE